MVAPRAGAAGAAPDPCPFVPSPLPKCALFLSPRVTPTLSRTHTCTRPPCTLSPPPCTLPSQAAAKAASEKASGSKGGEGASWEGLDPPNMNVQQLQVGGGAKGRGLLLREAVEVLAEACSLAPACVGGREGAGKQAATTLRRLLQRQWDRTGAWVGGAGSIRPQPKPCVNRIPPAPLPLHLHCAGGAGQAGAGHQVEPFEGQEGAGGAAAGKAARVLLDVAAAPAHTRLGRWRAACAATRACFHGLCTLVTRTSGQIWRRPSGRRWSTPAPAF